jgi:DNA-binding NarL/FixJ family response regulator
MTSTAISVMIDTTIIVSTLRPIDLTELKNIMIRVLIVDDQPKFRRQLRQLLTHAGLNVIGEAGDIPAAEIMVTELHPEMAIVDVMLPGLSGLDGTSRLKSLQADLRVILVSAYHDQAQVFQTSAAEVGAEAFISKDNLDLDIVRSWISNQQKN